MIHICFSLKRQNLDLLKILDWIFQQKIIFNPDPNKPKRPYKQTNVNTFEVGTSYTIADRDKVWQAFASQPYQKRFCFDSFLVFSEIFLLTFPPEFETSDYSICQTTTSLKSHQLVIVEIISQVILFIKYILIKFIK